MSNPLAAHPPWRQLLIVSVLLPLVISLAVLAFTWPTARVRPRDVPVGVVGTTATTQHVIAHLDAAQPGAFEFRLYPDAAAARAAIRSREVYGAILARPGRLGLLEASAAGPAVAALLTTAGQRIAQASTHDGSGPMAVSVEDVVPLSPRDPKGLLLSSALLPLTICSILVAAAVGVIVRFRPAWRQLVAVTVVSAVAGAGAYLVGQGWLGAFPRGGAGDWAALALTVLAMAAATAGLIALVGVAGLAAAAALFVFVGNPFAAATSAPPLLPGAVNHLGQLLPPGAGLNLLRSSAYFGGHGAGSHIAVLLAWTLVGFLAIAVGHHPPIRFAAAAGGRSRAGADQ